MPDHVLEHVNKRVHLPCKPEPSAHFFSRTAAAAVSTEAPLVAAPLREPLACATCCCSSALLLQIAHASSSARCTALLGKMWPHAGLLEILGTDEKQLE